MELRQNMRSTSTRPIVLLIALLSVFALGLTGWYVVAGGSPTHRTVVTTSGFPGPDATERNQHLQQARDNNPEVNHGH